MEFELKREPSVQGAEMTGELLLPPTQPRKSLEGYNEKEIALEIPPVERANLLTS